MGLTWLIRHFENQNISRKRLGELEMLISRNGRNLKIHQKIKDRYLFILFVDLFLDFLQIRFTGLFSHFRCQPSLLRCWMEEKIQGPD